MPRRKQDKPKRMKWEDGEQTNDKGADSQSDTVPVEGDGPDPSLGGSPSSRSSSRSGSPDPPTLPQVLPLPDASEVEERLGGSSSMDVLSKSSVPMDISSTLLTNPEQAQASENFDEDAEENDPPAPDITTGDDVPLDFSLKKSPGQYSTEDAEELRRTPNGVSPPLSQDGPLDLSVPRRRRDRVDFSRHTKLAKLETALSMPSSPWGYNVPKQLSKLIPKNSTADHSLWNGKVKTERRDRNLTSSTSLPKNSLNRHSVFHPLLHKNSSPPLDIKKSSSSKTDPYRPAGRQNPWQSQWMSRSSEQTKDVFTCVWCKESFRSLADMTVHMKQSPRCGMAGMQTSVPVTSPTAPSVSSQPSALQSSISPKCSTSSGSTAQTPGAVIKENVSLPRKLVRGQDVWLGKGAEQTRQILKCMWCGQSFKSLADMTTHMRVTQHYTNIISQEQIISWRTPEDKMAAQSQVNAVLTCKVCDQAFGSLKELSYHMVKNSHYKEHILRSITEGGGRRRQTRERRKKSLPVRKLLELERMELSKQSPSNPSEVSSQVKNEVIDGKISCEECTEKVDAKDFVQHIKNCAQGSRSQQSVKSPLSENVKPTSMSRESNQDVSTASGISTSISCISPISPHEPPTDDAKVSTGQAVQQQQEDNNSLGDSAESAGSTSVLNAIERLIEKSFETKGRRNTVSTGILQRLGIDEEVYPPWHPSSSPNTFGAFRSAVDFPSKSSTSPLGKMHEYKVEVGDFSGSESRSRSSSTSEKHPNFDDHLRLTFGLTAKDIMNRVSTPSSASQSCSPVNFRPESPTEDRNSVFKESSNSVAHAGSHTAPSTNISSPKRRRSATPCSERDALERNSVQDEDFHETDKEIDEVANAETVEKYESEDGHPLDFSERCTPRSEDRQTPRSEDRQTPISRSSSCEPETAASINISPTKLSKNIPKKRKNISTSENSHKVSVSSNKRKATHSSRSKNSDFTNDNGAESIVGSPMSCSSVDFASPVSRKHSDKAAGDHPLKELQKLLDKTDAHLSRPSLPATPGSILAFSWACNEATTSDSLMKCAFCDTHFISKGAYRHHLSKMHFVKDGSLAEIAAATTWKPQSTSGIKPGTPQGNVSNTNNNGNICGSAAVSGTSCNITDTVTQPSPTKDPQPASVDESPHSKFLKYTELAKQLSSKYV